MAVVPVLDGLDEVTEPTMSERLIQRFTEFVNDAEAENCDVFVVLTTRPVGYTENILQPSSSASTLTTWSPPGPCGTGRLPPKFGLRGDVERIEKVVKQLHQAAEDEALRNLLRRPLQVLILTIILDGAGQLAPDRYSLFWGYYETVFKRERDKQGGLHHMLREYGQQIQQLHERPGFELQVRSESGDRSYATLTSEELRQNLAGSGRSGLQAIRERRGLLDSIFAAARQRLVYRAARQRRLRVRRALASGTHGCHAPTSGPLNEVIRRLRRATAGPHWRNTSIFAAGRLFAIPRATNTRLWSAWSSLLTNVPRTGLAILRRSAGLALEIIDDGMEVPFPGGARV